MVYKLCPNSKNQDSGIYIPHVSLMEHFIKTRGEKALQTGGHTRALWNLPRIEMNCSHKQTPDLPVPHCEMYLRSTDCGTIEHTYDSGLNPGSIPH